jgi:hypothetical protein
MSSPVQNFVTPTGRLVWGDLYKPQDKDADGKPLVIKNGPDAGKARVQYAFGVAVPKGAERHWAETTWGAIIWATGHASAPQAAQSPAFAWKVTDGDSQIPNKKGKKPCDREGYRGHWVLSLGSSFAPRIYNRDGSQAILEPNAVKCGYYVQVAGTVVGNDSGQNPGVYLNHSLVALQGYGVEIVTGPDPTAVGFGGGPAPAGMLAQPPGGLPPTTVAPAAPGAPAASYAPPPPPGAMAPPPAAAPPPTVVTPAPSFLAPPAPAAPVYAPPPPMAAPVAPVVPAAPTLTPKAGGATYAAMIAAGWNDATLRQHGYLN